jgi:hypothetical protein
VNDIVRIVLLPKTASGTQATDRQIVIDLAIDGSGSVVGPFPAFGRIGDYKKPETLYPFALMSDGRLDYGAHASDVPQENLVIRGRSVRPGAEIVRSSVDGDELYRVETVSLLA